MAVKPAWARPGPGASELSAQTSWEVLGPRRKGGRATGQATGHHAGDPSSRKDVPHYAHTGPLQGALVRPPTARARSPGVVLSGAPSSPISLLLSLPFSLQI